MKNKTTAGLLALFLGGIGIHKFYLNQTTAGILYLLFSWTCIPAILAFIDCIILFTMPDDEFNKKYNSTNAPKNTQSIQDNTQTLLEYKNLLDQNVISQDEFNYIKEKILNQ